MAVTARKAGLAASLGAAVLVGSLVVAAARGGAAPGDVATFRTVSGSALCPPSGEECLTTLLNPSGGGARVNAAAPVVVQTGHLPDSGPELPVSLLTGVTGDLTPGGQQAFRWRVFDQSARVPTTADAITYFHASAPFTDAGRSAGSVLVNTDGEGNARVNFPAPLALNPVAVIVTGRSPYAGPGLPVNLVTSGYTRSGFTVRALDQYAAPIRSAAIRLHYWATAQGATPNTRAGQATVTPNAAGRAVIPWSMFERGLPPVSVVLTGTSPTSGPAMPVNLLAVTPQSNGVSVRVLDQNGRPITTPVRIAYYATKAAASTG